MRFSGSSSGWAKFVLRLATCAIVLLALLLVAGMGLMHLAALPDSLLVFEADYDGDFDIYRIDTRFNTLIKLTHNEVDDHDPAWSPITRQIVFASGSDGNTQTELFLMNEDGTNLHRISPTQGNYWNAALAADGQRIVYLLYYGNIHVLDLTAQADHYLGYGFAPAWSPVDERIATYANQRDTLNADVYVVDADGHNLHNMTSHPANDWDPAWSPDGKKLVFASSRDGNAELYVMDAGCEPLCGANVRRLTDVAYAAITPAWSPDGQQIAFAANEGSQSRIVLINVDGTGLHPVIKGRAPVWIDRK